MSWGGSQIYMSEYVYCFNTTKVKSLFFLYLYINTLDTVLPYLGMVGRFRGDDPRVGDFQSDWVPFYTSTRSDWPPLSAEKIGLSLPHLVPEILGPKVGLILTQNVLLNSF